MGGGLASALSALHLWALPPQQQSFLTHLEPLPKLLVMTKCLNAGSLVAPKASALSRACALGDFLPGGPPHSLLLLRSP